MNNRKAIFKTIGVCFLSFSTLQVYGCTSTLPEAVGGLLHMRIMALQAAQAATRMLVLQAESDKTVLEEAKKTDSELATCIAQLTEQHSTLVAAEQALQRTQQAITAKQTNPSYAPSKDEQREIATSLADTMRALQALLPEEEKGEIAEKVALCIARLTKKSEK